MTIEALDRPRTPADTFANRLILSRATAGHLSIREAAERCGLGRGAWQNWEKGARPDDYDALVSLIADRLGIDRTWLRNGGGLTPTVEQTKPARWARNRNKDVFHRAVTRPPRRAIDSRPPGRPRSPVAPVGQRRTARVG